MVWGGAEREQTAWLVRLAIGLLALALALVAPAFVPSVAHADDTAVFSGASPTPSSTALGVPAELSVIVSDASEPTAVLLRLNGISRNAYLTNGPASGLPGYWEPVWDPEEGEFYNRWVPLDPNLKKVVCPQGSYFWDYYHDDDHYYFNALVEGLNTIDVTVTSAEGISSYSWSFYYDPPPVISAVTPADGASLSETRPTISATITDDDATFESTMTVDGAVVPTEYDASTKTFSYTPLVPFDAPSSHVVSLQIRDAEDRTVSRIWSFSIVGQTVAFSDHVPAPGAVVTAPLGEIRLTADSEVAGLIRWQSGPLHLDGVALSTTTQHPGHWELDEWDDDQWVIDDPTVLHLSATAPPLTDGVHTIDTRVRDTNGADFLTDWEFTVAIPPTASAITPTVPLTGGRPYISAIVTDNSPGPLNARIVLDGQPVDSVFDPVTGLVSYTPDEPLAQGPHTAVFEMEDAAGNTSTASVEFTVSTSVFTEPSPADGEVRDSWPFTSGTQRAPVQIRAVSDVGLDPGSRVFRYDGIARGISVSGPAGDRDLTLSYNPGGDEVRDGPHTLRWEITDLEGVTHTEEIAFTVAIPPGLSAPVPVPGTPVNDSRPEIGLRIADNSPGPFAVVLSVDGTVVSDDLHADQGISSGEWVLDFRWTPASDFASGSSHVAEAMVTDAAGNVSTLSWEFEIAPAMYVDDCLSCHTDYLAAHPVDNCAACHGTEVASFNDMHWGGDGGAAPTPAGSCGAGSWACHNDEETHEWASDGLLHRFSGATMYRNFGRSALGCTDCHSEQWPTVPRHTDATLEPVHSSLLATGCTSCHNTSLVEEHAKYPRDSQVKYQCVTCHGSSDDRVEAAIDEWDGSCSTCHGDLGANHGDPAAAHAVVADETCADCHGSSLEVIHSGCASCHPPYTGPGITGETCISCHAAYTEPHGAGVRTWGPQDYYSWFSVGHDGVRLSDVGANPTNPGVHGNYLANTAKCGVCHSVHRAKGDGVKLLNTDNPTCAGCHVVGSTVTDLVVNWGTGPHGSGNAANCQNRACHLDNPHGAGGSGYKIIAAKLLNPGVDVELAAPLANPAASGITAADLNAEAGSMWDDATRSAVRTGYTCNMDGCHYNTMLAVLQPGWSEDRWSTYYEPENPAGSHGPYVKKTGHLSVAATDGTAYAPVTSCISCHDQTDSTTGNGQTTVSGYTFPHGQTPTAGSANNTDDSRAYLWMTTAGDIENSDAGFFADQTDKAKDGACLKCHRTSATNSGVGWTY
ncbi:MAG: hypothetical protein K0B85_05100 [Coriobacteriia bacterium]|nr:hypothetical protein [Coriobacteriia bacterium]